MGGEKLEINKYEEFYEENQTYNLLIINLRVVPLLVSLEPFHLLMCFTYFCTKIYVQQCIHIPCFTGIPRAK